MTAKELIEELEWAIERNGGDDVEVLTAQQPNWPFEYTIEQAITICKGDGADDSDENETRVYLGEGSQVGYLNEDASRELGW